MNREQVLATLNSQREEIMRCFEVKHLGIFGSCARGEMRPDSDIDVLVEFDGPPTFDGYMDLKFYLERLFGTGVDLVTEDAVRPRMRPMIEKDLIHVA